MSMPKGKDIINKAKIKRGKENNLGRSQALFKSGKAETSKMHSQ